MPNIMIGTQINNWLVVEKTTRKSNGAFLYKIKCLCGTIRFRRSYDIYRTPQCSECRKIDQQNELERQYKEYRIGTQLNKWIIIDGPLNLSNKGGKYFKIKCECGFERYTPYSSLKKIKSCRSCNKNNLSHGFSSHPSYNIWIKMIDRCYNIKNKFYKYYGGRSINVCERWRNSINNFIEDMGERPPNHELDRIDTDGNYDISNCRWVTHAQNMKNTRTAKKYREKYLFKTIKISNLCKQCLDQVNND